MREQRFVCIDGKLLKFTGRRFISPSPIKMNFLTSFINSNLSNGDGVKRKSDGGWVYLGRNDVEAMLKATNKCLLRRGFSRN